MPKDTRIKYHNLLGTISGRFNVQGVEAYPASRRWRGRQIPILSRTGRVVGHCTAPEAHPYA